MAFKPSETEERIAALAQFEPHLVRYWSETRNDIRALQRRRDVFLGLMILLVGAVVIGLLQSRPAQDYVLDSDAIACAGALLGILTVASWVRRRTLERIATNWSMLCRLVEPYFDPRLFSYLPEWEAYCETHGSKTARTELAIHYLLCIPAYAMLVFQIREGIDDQEYLRVLISAATASGHMLLTRRLLAGAFKDMYSMRHASLRDPNDDPINKFRMAPIEAHIRAVLSAKNSKP
ncbi:MAG: hypothetical protein ACKVU1_02785 [bacterium]